LEASYGFFGQCFGSQSTALARNVVMPVGINPPDACLWAQDPTGKPEKSATSASRAGSEHRRRRILALLATSQSSAHCRPAKKKYGTDRIL
jgi:hypothetical protein